MQVRIHHFHKIGMIHIEKKLTVKNCKSHLLKAIEPIESYWKLYNQ